MDELRKDQKTMRKGRTEMNKQINKERGFHQKKVGERNEKKNATKSETNTNKEKEKEIKSAKRKERSESSKQVAKKQGGKAARK